MRDFSTDLDAELDGVVEAILSAAPTPAITKMQSHSACPCRVIDSADMLTCCHCARPFKPTQTNIDECARCARG